MRYWYRLNPKEHYTKRVPRTPLHNTVDGSKRPEHKTKHFCLLGFCHRGAKKKLPTVATPFQGPATPPLRPRGAPLPTPPGHPPGPQAASRPAWATPQPPRRLGAPSSTLVEVETQNRAPAHTGALRDGAAARRASGAWGRCKAARGCGIGEWGWWGDWGACWGLVGVRTAHLAPISCRGGVAATSCKKARQRAPTPPNARAPRARRSLGRPDAAQQRPRAPGGVKRALSTCTRPLHAPTAYANAPPSTPPPPVERACARSSARAPRASPALRPVLPGTRPRKRRRGPFGPEVEKISRACTFERE